MKKGRGRQKEGERQREREGERSFWENMKNLFRGKELGKNAKRSQRN
jgi:hypothetical protein